MNLSYTTDADGLPCYAVVVQGTAVIHPDLSQCGRFLVNPIEYYSLTPEEIAFLYDQEDILDADTTDKLTNVLDRLCKDYGFEPTSADELLLQAVEANANQATLAWLITFIRRWEIIQANEDFEQALQARGEEI